ncbi:hypothetical protein SEPCBS119000_004152 [Sporothrix epigloea]|uniref:Uncharacterized protein n=1 Tax=Sporothrix epigloea TaxID=1892477 RepID=A0ABP0DQS2_9PEZI
MPPKAAAVEDGEAPKIKPMRPAQEDAAKVTKTGKGSGKRGRPKMDPALRKTQDYVPTGRPRGRPPKDPTKQAAPATQKAPPAAGTSAGSSHGRGRLAGSTKKAITSTATAVATVVAALSAARNVAMQRGHRSKAIPEAERSPKEAAVHGVKAPGDEDMDGGAS